LFTIDPLRRRYPGEQRNLVLDQLQQRIAAVPGVEAVTLSSVTVLDGGRSRTGVDTERPRPNENHNRTAWVNDVGDRFFETMGIPILDGRALGPLDRSGSQPVVVINQQFAREFFPNDNPLGKTFWNNRRAFEIVGVSGDSKYDRLRAPFPPTFYRHYLQQPPNIIGPMTFEVRTAARPASVVSAIREAVRSIDNDLPVFDIRSQSEQIDAALAQERLFVALSSVFAALAVVLACIGIYGVMTNSVSRRTNEIGIRMALGAGRHRVLFMILREVAAVAAVGAVLGTLASVGLTRYIQTMLFGVEPIDAATFGTAVFLMIVVAFLAGWLPARRASRLEPMAALRHE
jgi:predicted permease